MRHNQAGEMRGQSVKRIEFETLKIMFLFMKPQKSLKDHREMNLRGDNNQIKRHL